MQKKRLCKKTQRFMPFAKHTPRSRRKNTALLCTQTSTRVSQPKKKKNSTEDNKI